MTRLKKLESLVFDELTNNPNARKSDIALIVGIFERSGIDTSKPFAELALNGDLRQMESITRARRQVQAEHPELKDKETVKVRGELEKEFIEYARSV